MPVVCVIDNTGRAILGSVEGAGYPDLPEKVQLHDPVYLIERPNGKVVDLRLNPILHTFDVRTVMVKWTTAFAVDERLIDAYNDAVIQQRAARAGIVTPGQDKAG